VAGLLGAIDLAVFSSFNEGLPNAVLEAMAAGVAVVATDYPGISEAVGAAGLSLLVRSRDANDLADKIVLAALNPQMRKTSGAAGKARVAAAFSVARMANRMVELIQGELASVAEPEAGRRTD
jgi:glycosyltransferase involved in cell wall biosynthesis